MVCVLCMQAGSWCSAISDNDVCSVHAGGILVLSNQYNNVFCACRRDPGVQRSVIMMCVLCMQRDPGVQQSVIMMCVLCMQAGSWCSAISDNGVCSVHAGGILVFSNQ